MRASVSGGDFLHFLLLCAGLTLIAVALLWAPRREVTLGLEARRMAIETELRTERESAARYARLARAFETDPHYRRVVQGWASQHRRAGEMTVEEYVQRRPTRAPRPDS